MNNGEKKASEFAEYEQKNMEINLSVMKIAKM